MTAKIFRPAAIQPKERAAVPLYREGARCPGCSHSHWLVGIVTAQCAFCDTALPLPDGQPGFGRQAIVRSHPRAIVHRTDRGLFVCRSG